MKTPDCIMCRYEADPQLGYGHVLIMWRRLIIVPCSQFFAFELRWPDDTPANHPPDMRPVS